jgi:predicted CXXCH cytochrome family protein
MVLVEATPALLQIDRDRSVRVIPGRGTGEQAATPARWVDDHLAGLQRVLFDGAGGCGYCHREAGGDQRRPGQLPEYLPSRVGQQWFPGSRFDHDSHRLIACTQCHAAATSNRAADVLMPRIDLCRQCHQPEFGVASNCVICHRYHDRTREGMPAGTRTIDQCLGRVSLK